MNPAIEALRQDIADTVYAPQAGAIDVAAAVLAIVEKRLGPVIVKAQRVVENAKSHVGISKVEETYVFALERALYEAAKP